MRGRLACSSYTNVMHCAQFAFKPGVHALLWSSIKLCASLSYCLSVSPMNRLFLLTRCCLLLWKKGYYLTLSSTCFHGFQSKLGHRCIFWQGQRSYIKVKGYLRSSCKIGWKCENGLIWKAEVWFEPNLVCWYNMWNFLCSCSQRSCTKVKGHLRSSCKIGWKCESGLIWKVEVRLEPNLVYWYNMGTFTCSCGQRSYTKVKGHLRSSCKITWKYKFGLICMYT